MGGGAGIITKSAIDDACAEDLLDAARSLLVAAYAKVAAGDDRLSQEELLGQAVAAQQVQNSAWAIQSRRLAQAAAISERGCDASDMGANELAAEWFPLEVGARLGWSDRQAGARLGQACEATGYTPGLVDLAGQGELQPMKVTAVATVTAGAPGHVAAEVETRILAGDPEGTTTAKLAAKARRLLAKLAPVAADEASQQRRRERVGVFVTPHHEPGLAEVTAVMPTLDAAKLMACIDEHAHELQNVSTTGKTLAQSRVDALTDLVLNGAIVDTHLTLLIPLAEAAPSAVSEAVLVAESVTLAAPAAEYDDPPGWSAQDEQRWAELVRENQEHRARVAAERADRPGPADAWPSPDEWPPEWLSDESSLSAELPVDPLTTPDSWLPPDAGTGMRTISTTTSPGRVTFDDVLLPRVGVIPGAAVQELAEALGVKLSRALADPLTGVIAETGDKTYRPGAGLARFVRARDQHCRFPGCTHPAERCDLDHVVGYPDGPTAAHNLQPLCRHHHRAKHEGGWNVTMTPDGVCTWTSPTGRIYITEPAD